MKNFSMRGWIILMVTLGFFAVNNLPAQTSPPWSISLELDQMFALKVGVEHRFTDHFGLRAAAGCSLFNITHISWDLTGVYHLMHPDARFQLDVEVGLPVAYFNPFENALVDWDPIIDDPYAGFGTGATIVWGYRFDAGRLGLKTGVFLLNEYQRDSGWREPAILPEISVEWGFQ